MGKGERNRRILALLNDEDKSKIIDFVKEKNLIHTEAPTCDNEKCEGYLKRKMIWQSVLQPI
jgi:hypothetical protein